MILDGTNIRLTLHKFITIRIDPARAHHQHKTHEVLFIHVAIQNKFVHKYKIYIVNQLCFDIGFRFYYWNHYKDIDQTYQIDQHDDNQNDHGGYSPSDLFIKRKYRNLKEEVT